MRTPILALPLLALAACTDRPLQTTDADTTGSSTSAAPTTEAPTTTAPGTTTGVTTTSTASTTGVDDTTTTGTTAPVDTTATATTAPDGPPSTCGPPCDATWEHFGDLNIDAAGDFSCLTRVHGNLTIAAQSAPAVVATLANLRTVDENLYIASHPLTDLSTFACVTDLGQLSLTGMPQLTDLSALAGLRSAASIHFQDLGLTALPTFAPDFTGIYGLTLRDNPKLTDLSAASSWGPLPDGTLGLLLERNTALTSLAGLAGLIAASAPNQLQLQLIDHPKLTSLAGLEAATDVYLYLKQLPALTDLDPLKNVVSATYIVLSGIPLVKDLSGLSNLVEAADLQIGDCGDQNSDGLAGLTSLAGLDSLVHTSSLSLLNNAGLASLDGAPKLTSVDVSVIAVNNPALTQKAYDAFLSQLGGPPLEDCLGGWDTCQCFILMPW